MVGCDVDNAGVHDRLLVSMFLLDGGGGVLRWQRESVTCVDGGNE